MRWDELTEVSVGEAVGPGFFGLMGVLVLLASAALAVWRPLGRAMRVDPVASLRCE